MSFFFYITALLYVVWLIPTLPIEKSSIFTELTSNEIHSSVTIFVIIFSVIGIADGVINRKMSNDKSGVVRRPIMFTELDKMKIDCSRLEESKSSTEKAKRTLQKVNVIVSLQSQTKSSSSVKENPLRRKFFSLCCFWVVLHYMVYFHLVTLARDDPNKTWWTFLVSFYSEQASVKNYAWVAIRVFYFLCLCYVYVGISQIHYGQELFSSNVIKWGKIQQITHTVTDLIPFYREMGVLMDFLANKSSLQLRNKISASDITHYFWTSRIEEVNRTHTGYGYKPGSVVKLSVCLLWSIVTALLVFGPLLPFVSFFNFNNVVYIKDASMQINFRDSSGNNVGRVFETQINQQSHSPNATESYFKEYNAVRQLSSQPMKIDLFEQLTLSKASETLSTIDDRFTAARSQESAAKVLNIIATGSLVFHLKVQVILTYFSSKTTRNTHFLKVCLSREKEKNLPKNLPIS